MIQHLSVVVTGLCMTLAADWAQLVGGAEHHHFRSVYAASAPTDGEFRFAAQQLQYELVVPLQAQGPPDFDMFRLFQPSPGPTETNISRMGDWP